MAQVFRDPFSNGKDRVYVRVSDAPGNTGFFLPILPKYLQVSMNSELLIDCDTGHLTVQYLFKLI